MFPVQLTVSTCSPCPLGCQQFLFDNSCVSCYSPHFQLINHKRQPFKQYQHLYPITQNNNKNNLAFFEYNLSTNLTVFKLVAIVQLEWI